VLVCLDVLAVLLAVVLGPLLLGSWLGLAVYRPSLTDIVIALVVTICVAAVRGLYGRREIRHRAMGIVNGAFAVLLVLALLVAVSGHPIQGPSLFLYWLLGAFSVLALRRGYDLAVSAFIGRDLDARRLLVVGSAAEGTRLLATVAAADPKVRYALVGSVPAELLPDIFATCEELWPSEVVLADLEGARPHIARLLQVCRVRHMPLKVSLAGLAGADETVSFLPGFTEPLFAVRDSHARRRHYVVKRLIDVVASALLLVLLSPALVVIAALVKLTSRGPVFYLSARVGVGQRPFPCYKFRTMSADAEARQAELECLNEAEGCIFKIAADPRLTRVGGFLRRTSLDELPQLFNVLCGQMSLVGPRPLPLRDVDLMADWHKRRHVVLPGLTGLWQVSGRSGLGFEDMIELDYRYIETWSLRGDLAILARTAGAVVARKGAY
jgi:exopolysaccharide biosynthesis polyprenyl glycosylphosphotransferase